MLTISAMDHGADLLFLLHDVARLTRVNADKRARSQGMTRAQWVILIRLDRKPGVSQKELAEILEVEPITVGRLIDRMAQRGLLERRADPADRRIWRLHLLPAGAASLASLAGQRDALARDVTEGIPLEILQSALEGLSRMKANLCQERAVQRGLDRAGPRRVA